MTFHTPTPIESALNENGTKSDQTLNQAPPKEGKFRPIFLNDIPALPRTSDSITKMSSRGPCRRAGKTRPITGQRSARPATCVELTG